jgi:Cytochrome c554 and c-prime
LHLAIAVVVAVFAVAIFGNYLAIHRSFLPKMSVDGASQPTSSLIKELASYVGRERCGRCHSTEANAWESSHHARAMRLATSANMEGDFNDAHFSDGDVTTTFYRKDGKFMVRTDGPDGALQDFEAKYTFGTSPLEQYLVEIPGGRRL